MTVRVEGFDRLASFTQFAVTLENTGEERLVLEHAYALVEDQVLLERLSFDAGGPIEPGESRTVPLTSHHSISLRETLLALALDVRAGRKRLPFLLRVPPEKPDDLVPQPPPRRLPVFRSTSFRRLIPWIAAAIVLFWWDRWFALAVPIVYFSLWYLGIRTTGKLPKRLDPIRYALNAAVVLGGTYLLWLSPAIYFASAWLVMCLVFLVLRPVVRRPDMRAMAAVTAGFVWAFTLGIADKPLSPCRLVDGTPSATADAFARATFTGDLAAAARHADFGATIGRYFHPSRGQSIPALIATRRSAGSGSPACKAVVDGNAAIACYTYRFRTARFRFDVLTLAVAVECDGTSWRVSRRRSADG